MKSIFLLLFPLLFFGHVQGSGARDFHFTNPFFQTEGGAMQGDRSTATPFIDVYEEDPLPETGGSYSASPPRRRLPVIPVTAAHAADDDLPLPFLSGLLHRAEVGQNGIVYSAASVVCLTEVAAQARLLDELTKLQCNWQRDSPISD